MSLHQQVISSKSNTVHTLDGTDGQETLADKFTFANGSTNTPLSSVATTTLSDLLFNQSHNSFCNYSICKICITTSCEYQT